MGKLRDFGNKLKDSLGKLRREKKPEVIPEETIFAPKLSDECFSLLSSLFDELGPRPAASDASRNAARRIASQFEKFTDDVTVTTGKIIPDITKWHLVSLAVFSSVVFLFSFIGLPYIALPIAILFIIAISRDLAKKSNPLRRFFPSAVATNVHAVIEPEEEVYRTIIFSAHHDTASISGIDDAKMKAVFSMNTALLGFLALSIVSLLSFIAEIFEGRLFRANIPDALIVILLFLSFLASLAAVYIISMSGKEYTGGAGDNLSGVAIVTTLGLYFSREKKVGRGMKNTRPLQPQEELAIPADKIQETSIIDIPLKDIDGQVRHLTDLKGKVVLIDFTAYAAPTSGVRNLALRELYDKYAPQGFEIYQISFDTDEHFWKTASDNLPWICVRDPQGPYSSYISLYGLTQLPGSFLVNRSNELSVRLDGNADLEAEIKKLL